MSNKQIAAITSTVWIVLLIAALACQRAVLSRQFARSKALSDAKRGLAICISDLELYQRVGDEKYIANRTQTTDYILDCCAFDLATFPQAGLSDGDRWLLAGSLADAWAFRQQHARAYAYDPALHSRTPDDVDRKVVEYVLHVCGDQPQRKDDLLNRAGPSLLERAAQWGLTGMDTDAQQTRGRLASSPP